MEKLYSVQDLCQRYGVKDFTVWEWIRTGKPVIDIDTATIGKAVLTYGIHMQSVVAMEECAELQKEISKLLRGSGTRTHLLEEMADVAICLKQLQLMYNIDDEDLHLVIRQKLDRLEGRLNGHIRTDIHSTQMR